MNEDLCQENSEPADSKGSGSKSLPNCQSGPDDDAVRMAILDLHWMARRYADGRCSYAPTLLNRRVRDLLAFGYELKSPLFARDGMGRLYDGLSDDEVQAAEEDMPNGYARHLTETQERLEQEIAAASAKVRKDTIEECIAALDEAAMSGYDDYSRQDVLRSLLEKKP